MHIFPCPPQGYLIVPQFFDKADLDACRRDIEVLVDELAAKLFKAGKIKGEQSFLFNEVSFIQ